MVFEQQISEDIFRRKYMLNNEKSSDEVFHEVAKEIASVEKDKDKWENIFYDYLSSAKLMAGGRILANARTNSKNKNYNNCFTIDIEDSMQDIFSSLKEDATISAVGGGVGFNISKLRPNGAPIKSGGETSGPISFLKIFNESAKVIQTGGGRRSAHIAIMNVDHPDIEEFITVKQGDKNKELTQFNISVGITDAFIKAVEEDLDWNLQFEGKVYKTIKAKYLYDLMTRNSYEHNEPGILNLDTVEKYNNGWWAFKVDRTNPCGEICMPSYSLCCLSSVNLSKFIKNPFTSSAEFDFEDYASTIKVGIRFLDNVLDITNYPLKKIEDVSKQWRRIGLGFTALGDMFAMMNIEYGSKESLEFSEKLAKALRDVSYSESVNLAKEKGSFPSFDKKILDSNFIKQLPDTIRFDIEKYGLRNIGLNTCAPNGTISLTVGQNCSSGIEPIFALKYDRNIRTGNGDETKKETVYDYAYLKYLDHVKSTNTEMDKELFDKIFITTSKIDPYKSVDVQATWQKYIDHSISKTANLPSNYPFEEYKNLFMYAYKNGLKGFTSFNPTGSLKGILETSDSKRENVVENHAPKRPTDLIADVHSVKVKEDNFLVIVGLYNNKPYELFVTNITHDEPFEMAVKYGKGIIRKQSKGNYNLVVQNGEEKIAIKNIGKVFNGDYESMSRLISTSLRHGVPLQFIVDQLSKEKSFASFGKAISRVLKHYIKEGEKVLSNDKCPECGSTLIYQDGCKSCLCGWSKCS